ncbi:Asp-tRNA(Asn)/Glu-tRNA(Gln) amidotransferase subunit GatA [Anaerotruncus rubiinfantis]|uniref:Asp-tRNA(Asn)/Glu-tRNA(Gln) amidotransferase subunit GatA n=1 Tax=Anaerotruncus rubiinfantis TaxID=1720200 RepID=UPI000835DDB2|nr:Asp-tRNA(Asn)/Glu-tRNA(Gln) amidotransferase subunit GatA [Anaerotruncus rubiinfantis]
MIGKLHRMLETREISCAELTEKYLSAIENENANLNAYITVASEEAKKAARLVDARIAAGESLRPLEGIPMTLKDNISTKGILTTCASKILDGYRPIYDAFVWKQLRQQGAVLLGKSNMDEFAMGSSCETSYYGGAANPRSTSYVAGGSSGGVAAAVGGNLAAYGLGSDTGGSIRQPASFCGLVGLKPTYGAVSRFGLIAYGSSLDQVGPITASVEDAALVYDAICGYDPMDSTSQGGKPVSGALKNGVKGLRIGLPDEYYEGLTSSVRAALGDAAKAYESLGAEMVRFPLPELKFALPVYYIIACAEAASNLGRYDGIRYGYQTKDYHGIHEMICKTRSEGFGAEVKRRILLGNYVLSSGYYDAYYKKAQNLRGAIVQAFAKAFETCDVILAPTVPMTAFPRGRKQSDPTEDYLTDICTVPVNIAGLPAVSVPCGQDQKGLPIGMQLIGRAFDEAGILAAAYAYEQSAACVKPCEMGVRL